MDIDEGTRAIIKETAREVLNEIKKHWDKEMNGKITTHSLQCAVNKNNKIKGFISAVIGGIIVAIFTWLLK